MSVPGEKLADPGQFAAAYIEKKWGGPTRLVPPSIVLPSTFGNPTRVFLNNPRRMEWFIANPSAISVFIDITSNPTSSTILVSPLGGSVLMLIDEDGEAVTYEVWAVAAAPGSAIYTWEVVRK